MHCTVQHSLCYIRTSITIFFTSTKELELGGEWRELGGEEGRGKRGEGRGREGIFKRLGKEELGRKEEGRKMFKIGERL